VLLDLSMPGMGGEEAFSQLRRLHPNAKVLVVSGHDQTEVMRKFGDAKIAGFPQKPFTAGGLVQKIREIANG
jgi:two-component system cell cycle sensor histidine kinase/response regulator CckA